MMTTNTIFLLTSEHSARLFHIEIMIRAEYQRDRAKLKIQSCPTEGDPKREEENNGLGEKHV